MAVRGRSPLVMLAALALLAGCTPAVSAQAVPVAQPARSAQPPFPIRAAFFYPWFPEAWDQKSISPYSRYHPLAGMYDSGDPQTIAGQVRALVYGRFQAAIVSWWGRGQKSEDVRIPALLATAASVAPDLRFTLYYEHEGTADPSVDEIVSDLRYIRDRYTTADNYLRVDGRPVLFVYSANDTTCAVADRWAAATAVVDFSVVLKVFPGWPGCRAQPAGWHQYAPVQPLDAVMPRDPAVRGSVTISPGFWRPEDPGPLLARDPARWSGDVRAMTRSEAAWQLVTSFNEWGEGTAVEGAQQWASPSGQGVYLDALHAVP